MKFNNRAFPYPILDTTDKLRDDYIESTYIVSVEEFFDETKNEFTLTLEHICSVLELESLVKAGFAKYGVLVINKDTLYREMFVSDKTSHQVNLKLQDFHGRVIFIPQIIVTKHKEGYFSEQLNDEYGESSFELNPGDVLANAETFIRFFEFNKLSFETLISVRTNEDINPNRYEITLEKNAIYIDMGIHLRKLWDDFRTDSEKRPFLAMSIYKDCFFHALYDFSNNYEDVSDNKWAKALSQKLQEMNIEIKGEESINDLNGLAQQMLESETIYKLRITEG